MILGMGVDIVHIQRIEKAAIRWGERFTLRLFTKEELDCCLGRKNPYEGLALRFAAKEACSKALGTGIGRGISWLDIYVLNSDFGKPVLKLRGAAFKKASEIGARYWHVTLSHETQYGIAMVIIED